MSIDSSCTKRCFLSSSLLIFSFLLSLNVFSKNCCFKDTYPENNSDSLERWLILNPKIDETKLKNLIKIERSYSWELNDISAKISILSYLSLLYIGHNGSETENLAKYYVQKAKTLVNATTENVQIKQNSEKQMALARSLIIENTNQRLNRYLWIVSVLLILMSITLLILIKCYYREKQITSFRDKFYTILTHDLRGSINSLTNMGSVLNHLIRMKNAVELEQVSNQIDYLSCSTSLLLDNMLDWGTSKSYGMDITAQSFDISFFLNELVAHYLPALRTKNITIYLQIPSNLILKTSPKCIDIILRNLIANAMSNTESGGSITIELKENLQTQQISIGVCDTGEGIEESKLAFIKKVFNRKITPEVGDSGLGLGIILISHYARKNNSTLEVTSQIGVGSCFTVGINKL